jgi:hypothetical protein
LFLLVSTLAGTATGGSSCGGNSDFISVQNVGVTLNQRTPVDFTVPLCGDTRDELDETFSIRIQQTNGQQVTPNQVSATIIDDDPTPTLRINDVQLNEPASGGMATATFTVSLSAASGQDVSFTWETTAAQAGLPATGGSCGAVGMDFTAVAPTPKTISAGSPSTSVAVTVCGDGVYEGSEHLRVRLSGASNATFADDAGVLTIVDREQPPVLSIGPTITFGPSTPVSTLTGAANFTITLAGPPTERPVTFDYATANGTATGSTSCLDVNFGGVVRRAGDYLSKNATNVTIAPPSMPLAVNYCKLRAVSGKTFTLQLTNLKNATAGTVSRTATLP